MRGTKAILVSAALVLAAVFLAACSHGGNGSGNNTNASGSNGSGNNTNISGSNGSGDNTNVSGGNGGGSVTGTVYWPDQNPAVNASVYFYNADSGFSGNGWSPGEDSQGNWDGTYYYLQQQLPADGSYSLPGCPCAELTAFLYIPATYGADPANGGRDCWIIMQDDSGNFSGLQANPGDVINWHALDMNCSPIPYASDPSSVQSQRIATDPSVNGGDYTQYAGTWQAAESRTSGGGSSS